MSTDFLSEIDFCIKTYLRPQACENLVQSIRKFYPGAQIMVNEDPCIAKGRNAMVRGTKRPFLLMLDDDFLFTEETDIGWLRDVLHIVPCHVAAGIVVDCSNGDRVPRNSGGNLRLHDGTLYLDKLSRDRGTVDVVPNFFLARREIFKDCQWRFGIGAEHADFFMQLKEREFMVVQDDRITIDHDLNAPALPGYKAARWNVAANVLAFMNHWGIDQVLVNGKVAHNRLPTGIAHD